MPPIATVTEDKSIIKDAICFAMYPCRQVTADELFRNVSRNLSYSRERFEGLLLELVKERRIIKGTSDPPIYNLP
jgi:hypothetical protein